MKQTMCIALFCCVSATTLAQQAFPGYRSGNYSGINGVFFNPASIADSRYRWSFNLLSANAGVGNNTASFKLKDITSNSDDIEDKFLSGDGNTSASVNVDVFGPSLMFNLNKKSALAITTRARVMSNIKEIDGQILESITDSDNSFPYTLSSGSNSRIISNGWSEIGLSYARELSNKNQHYFKGGITAKYLAGVGNNYVQLDKINGTINEDLLGDSYLENSSGTINIGSGGRRIEDIEADAIFKSGQSGFGADIGFVYEYRPDYAAATGSDAYRRDLNKYKYKISVSVLDLGKIKYVTDPETTGGYNINISGPERFYLSELDGKNTDEIKDVLNSYPNLFTPTTAGTATSYKVSLPTTLQVEMDYHMHRGFFASLGGQFNLVKKNSLVNPHQYNSVTLTPRYEGKAFGFYLPINYNELTDFNVGVSLRAGPLFIGSGSIITAISKSKQADVHAGLRFGILHKKKKEKEVEEVPVVDDKVVAPLDTDSDGVFDTEDKCITVPGLAKYEGCPIPDTDGDGVNDETDKCINVAGLAKYEGCPVPDTDNDGVNDETDKCITIAGLAKYDGCPIPDTDKDGINDEEDKCPTVPGVATNFGCPEIKADVIKKVEFAASNLFFATGKSVILPKSFAGLNTLANVLLSDPSFKLSLDGHTDDVGTEENNQKLSEDRANSAKAYFVKKGIDESRISTAGFGESKPIADNKTAAGKTKNRRVEFKITNY